MHLPLVTGEGGAYVVLVSWDPQGRYLGGFLNETGRLGDFRHFDFLRYLDRFWANDIRDYIQVLRMRETRPFLFFSFLYFFFLSAS